MTISPFSVQPNSSSGSERRYYLDMTMLLEASFEYKIYVAGTTGFATRPDDKVASQPFRGVLEDYSFSRDIMRDEIGRFTTGSGSLSISNGDGYYDFLARDYTVEARPIALRLAARDGSYDRAYPFAQVTANGWNIDTDGIRCDLVDYSYKLQVPMQPNLYGGTGGADGGADLEGKRKPLVFGPAREIGPPLVVPSLLIYQVNDGPVQDVVGVRDRGAPLTKGADYASYATLAAAAIASGSFATCKALGLFRLNGSPSGQVTADVQGDNRDGYVTTHADVVRWAIRNRTALRDPEDLAVQSFATVNSQQPATIDYWLGPDDSLTVADFIANIMAGAGGWGGHRRDATFEVRIFSAPSGAPVQSFTRNDMFGGDIKREPLPSAYQPMPSRWRIECERCWTVQTDLAGSVGAAHKAFVAEGYRVGEASSAAIKVDHPFAQDRDPTPAYFSYRADADTEALRRLTIFRTQRAIYRATLPKRALKLDLGDEIRISHDRFDLAQGRKMVVVDMKDRVSIGSDIVVSVEVAAYG